MSGLCSDGLASCAPSSKEGRLYFTDWVTNIMLVDNSTCNNAEESECRDKGLALDLKLAAICAILTAGALGIALPLLGRNIKCLKSDGVFFVVAKAFAAGVILATGFVHMIPHGMEVLTSLCLPEVPFRKFPFAGFIALLAALGTLLVDVLATEYYEKKQIGTPNNEASNPPPQSSTPIDGDSLNNNNNNNKEIETCENGDHMHIVGIRAHAASHSHSHPHGHHSCNNNTHEHAHGQIGHSHVSPSREDKNSSTVRHLVISQVLELGIALHSVIIGISLGVSQSTCTIRPLLAALSFHQFFEGFALGGCISQAGFKSLSSVLMALCFALTTPVGIGIGIGVASSYNAHSSRALVVEGVFDSISAGILIYMALVDLIAADFLSKRMCCNRQLQIMSYMALFLGAITMSLLAIWA